MSGNVYFVCPNCKGTRLRLQGYITYDQNFAVNVINSRNRSWKGWIQPESPVIEEGRIQEAQECFCYCSSCWKHILAMNKDESYWDFSERLIKWLCDHNMYDLEEEECDDSVCG
jgi:hypothetical protein